MMGRDFTCVYFTVGDITFKIQARDCMKPLETISGPKCYDDDNEVIGVSIILGVEFWRKHFGNFMFEYRFICIWTIKESGICSNSVLFVRLIGKTDDFWT